MTAEDMLMEPIDESEEEAFERHNATTEEAAHNAHLAFAHQGLRLLFVLVKERPPTHVSCQRKYVVDRR